MGWLSLEVWEEVARWWLAVAEIQAIRGASFPYLDEALQEQILERLQDQMESYRSAEELEVEALERRAEQLANLRQAQAILAGR